MTDIDHRKVYARGFFDGLAAVQMASQDPYSMTPSKFQLILNGQTNTAKKVYQAVPMQEAWSSARIHQELLRINEGGGRDIRVTAGCLKALKEAGLLKEPERGEYMRLDIRTPRPPRMVTFADQEQQQETIEVQAMPIIAINPTKTQQKPSPMELLAALASRSKELGRLASSLEADIEAAAITIEDYIANEAANSAKLKQLQELLKNLAG